MAFAGKDTAPEKHTGFTFRGKEIVLSKTRGRPFGGLKAKGMEKGIYPEEKRIEAVTLYAATGNFPLVSELSGVPESILRGWRKAEWFAALLSEIRQENNAKLDAKFTEIVEGALEQLTDRIVNGDHHVLRDGTVIRKPISAKDLSLVAAINVDKRQLLRGEPTSRSESVDKVGDKAVNKLEKLAETFENLARFGRQPKVIEVEDAVQITGPESLDVREQTEDGAGVAITHSEGQETPKEG